PPSTGVVYYYVVQSYNTAGTGQSAEKSAMNVACSANLANTRMIITKVNGIAYTSNTVINNGDRLTYQITLVNSGPSNATINFIDDTPSSNLKSLRNLTIVSAPGLSANSGITPSVCAPTCRINISGTKN